MKKRRRTTTKVGLILQIFAVLAIALLPFQAWAQDMEDIDNDGFDDESSCIHVLNECIDTDPLIPDLFVMLVRPTGSLLPLNPFEFMPLSFTDADGNVTFMDTHVLELLDLPWQGQAITESQNAVLLIVDLDTNDGDLGASQIGYPAYGDGIQGRVFTNRIRDDVEKACSLQIPEECRAVDSDGIPYLDENDNEIKGIEAITNLFTKNVIAHETFHMLGRVVPADKKLDYDYAQLGYVMDHHVYYKEYKREDLVRWFISKKWDRMDIPRFK